MPRIVMRYVVRNQRGEELLVPSLADLRALYADGFLVDADQVRRESSSDWSRLEGFDALRGARARRRGSPLRMAIYLVAAMIVALGIGLLLTGSR